MKSIAVDFDGTIYHKKNWTKAVEFLGDPVDGAKESMDELRELGFRLVIHTARLSADFIDMKPGVNGGTENDRIKIECGLSKWLDDHDIPYDRIWTEQGKPHAAFYLDDRSIHFTDWVSAISEIRELAT